jgi:hypothetical protein
MTREELKLQDDIRFESVVVPEWGGDTFWVRSPASEEKDAFEESLLVEKRTLVKGRIKKTRETSTENVRAKLVVLLTCNGEGDITPYFKPGDEAWLGKKNGAAVDRLFDVAQRLAGFTQQDLEELVGN